MYGLWVALLAAIGVGVGGFLKSKEPEASRYGGPSELPPARRRTRRRPGWPPLLPPPGGRRLTATDADLPRGPAAAGPRRDVRGAARRARRPYCEPMAANAEDLLRGDWRRAQRRAEPRMWIAVAGMGCVLAVIGLCLISGDAQAATAATTARTCRASCCAWPSWLAGYLLDAPLPRGAGRERGRDRGDAGPAGAGVLPDLRRRRPRAVLVRGRARPAGAGVGLSPT